MNHVLIEGFDSEKSQSSTSSGKVYVSMSYAALRTCLQQHILWHTVNHLHNYDLSFLLNRGKEAMSISLSLGLHETVTDLMKLPSSH